MLPKFLKKSYPTERHLFLVPKFALRLIGFYPESEQSMWLLLWASFNFFVLTYGSYAELYYGIYYLSIDVVAALDALCPVASSLLSLLKMCYIWWYRADLKRLIRRVRALTEAQNSPEKTLTKRRVFTLATRLTALVLWFGFCTSTSYTIRPLLMNALRIWRGAEFLFETPFKMMFPDPLLSMPFYPFTFLFSHWHGYITVACFVGADGFFVSFCLYFATLLKALQEDLVRLLADADERQSNERELCDELTKIIVRHNEIADLVQKFSAIMAGITLGHFVTSSIIIGTSVIDLLLFSDYGIVVYVVYTCAVVTELFLYCLGGTVVMESSAQIATTAYSSEWYTHGVRVQKMVLLLILRAQRDFVIKMPFFAPSLPVLTSILRFTGSLIALAKSIM